MHVPACRLARHDTPMFKLYFNAFSSLVMPTALHDWRKRVLGSARRRWEMVLEAMRKEVRRGNDMGETVHLRRSRLLLTGEQGLNQIQLDRHAEENSPTDPPNTNFLT